MDLFIVDSGNGGSGQVLTQAAKLRFLLDVSIVIVDQMICVTVDVEDFVTEMEGLKGFGIASPEELRKQLENHVVTIDTLHNENRLAVECHENEKKVLKESVARAYLDELTFDSRFTWIAIFNLPCVIDQYLGKMVTRRRINFTVDNSEPSLTGQRIGFSVSSCSLVSEKYGKLASSI
ncbi:unnamed protein product [Prunus armeniaca]|uniref:Uncharacterized protein n=1 Tax=Prunus armeniaca TaxID=36596 RepID=A0A6J5WP82_PRUAR|nr:unnamed protein product [Prunus armeniaca]